MHHKIFDIDEILRRVVSFIVQMGRQKDAISLAWCRKSFEELVLSMVWEKMSLETFTRLLPVYDKRFGVWDVTTVRARTCWNPDHDTDLEMFFLENSALPHANGVREADAVRVLDKDS